MTIQLERSRDSVYSTSPLWAKLLGESRSGAQGGATIWSVRPSPQQEVKLMWNGGVAFPGTREH